MLFPIRASRFHGAFFVFQVSAGDRLGDGAFFRLGRAGENHLFFFRSSPDVHSRAHLKGQECPEEARKSHPVRPVKSEYRRADRNGYQDYNNQPEFKQKIKQNAGTHRNKHNEKLPHRDRPEYLVFHINELGDLELFHKLTDDLQLTTNDEILSC